MSSKYPFAIGVTRLRKEPAWVMNFDLSGAIADLKVASSYVMDDQLIDVAGTAEWVHGGILITGKISTQWEGECRRCLGPTSGSLQISFRELYERVEPGGELAGEGDTYPYSGDIIDVGEMVKDQVLLELPLAPLCKDECKGLCVSCGSDQNLGDCGCVETEIDPRWQALDILVDKDR
ncbi:MAG: DUF177 domain-containing protein [Acidimicrobiaceae bacterium]|nr:DUF177 domain-containing protein [Acidimicrobiaceae bacterium]